MAVLAVTGYLLYGHLVRRERSKAVKKERQVEEKNERKRRSWNLRSWLRPAIAIAVVSLLLYAIWPRMQPTTVTPDDRSLINTAISLDVPESANTGQSFNIKGRLTGTDNGTESSLSNEKISLVISPLAGGTRNTFELLTGPDGDFTYDVKLEHPGEYEINAVFNNTRGIFFESSESRNIVVAGTSEQPPGNRDSLRWISLIFSILAIVGIIVLALLYFRRYRKSRPHKPIEIPYEKIGESPPLATPPELPTKATPDLRLRIEFPQIQVPLPDVWGLGENLIVIFTGSRENRGKSAGEELDIELESGLRSRAIVSQESRAAKAHTYASTGEYQIKAAFAGESGDGKAVASRSVRIVDYREEIVRLYNEVVMMLQSRGAVLSPKMTARDVERSLAMTVPALPYENVGEIVSIFEEANYSLHPIGRSKYEKMFLASLEVRKKTPVKSEARNTPNNP
jgi:hypothetical protein